MCTRMIHLEVETELACAPGFPIEPWSAPCSILSLSFCYWHGQVLDVVTAVTDRGDQTRGSRQLPCCVPRHAGHGNLCFSGHTLKLTSYIGSECTDSVGKTAEVLKAGQVFVLLQMKVVDFFHSLWNNHSSITNLILGYILHLLLTQEAESPLGCSPRVGGPTVLQDKVYQTLPHGPAESGARPRHHSAELGDHTQAQEARLPMRRLVG